MKELSIDEIYQKHYSNVDREDFDEVIAADPKTIPGVKMGDYGFILLDMYRMDNLRFRDDLKKAHYYLSLAYKNNLTIPSTAICLDDIFDVVKEYIVV